MNNEEAIKELQKHIDLIHWDYDEMDQVLCKYKQALLKAVEALEKQIPLKPTRVDNCENVSISERCCKCYEIIDDTYSYCPECGQAIDWSK